MESLYDPACLLDPTCFSFLNSLYDETMSHNRDNELLKDAPVRKPASNAFGLNYPFLPSLTSTNQPGIFLAAVGPTAIPRVPLVAKPTPPHLRMQFGLLPDVVPSSAQLAPVIAAELKNNTIEAGPEFLNLLFPESRAPFKLEGKVFSKLAAKSLFNIHENRFLLPESFKEPVLGQWMNDIGEVLSETYHVPLLRRWWHGTNFLPPTGSDYLLKPDLVLLDASYHDRISNKKAGDTRINWLLVRSFAEVTSEKTVPSRMPATIDAKSYILLSYQFDRRFVPALSIVGSGKYCLTLTDREGQIRFHGLSLSDPNRHNALSFLRILSFFMFSPIADIGLDPHFDHDPQTGKVVAIRVDNRRFNLEHRIYTLGNMLGRGTKVWIVSSNNSLYILKDSWIQAERCTSEVTHLQAMSGHDEIKGLVPIIACGGDVKIGGELDTTSAYRLNFLGQVHRRRTHRRIVTSPVGEAITKFRSKKELISVLMDVIRGKSSDRLDIEYDETHRHLVAHGYLTRNLRILHRDISIGNIMLARQEGSEVARGLLIDFDYSEELDEENTVDSIVGAEESDNGDSCVAQVTSSSGDTAADEDEADRPREKIWTVCHFQLNSLE